VNRPKSSFALCAALAALSCAVLASRAQAAPPAVALGELLALGDADWRGFFPSYNGGGGGA